MSTKYIRGYRDLFGLVDEINRVRPNIEDQDRNFYFPWQGEKKRANAQKICADNERAYDGLPKEIPVSTDMAQFLSKTMTDYVAESKRIDRSDSFQIAKIIGSFIAVAVFPNPHTVHMLLGRAGTIRKLAQNSNENLALNKEEKNILTTCILETYQLTKDDAGKYVLRRGEWETYLERPPHPNGRAAGATYYAMRMKDVGISSSIDISALNDRKL